MIRSLLSLLLALTLAASSVSAAVTHSRMQGAQQMVICSDSDTASGLITITLDASGKPITSHHHCPDCTAAFTALLPGLIELAPRSATLAPQHPLDAADRASRISPPQSARDPPAFA